MNNTIKIAIALECAAKYRETGGNDLMNAVVELRRLAIVERELEECKAAYEAQRVQQYDQQALELCDVCGWKTLIPDEGCLSCERKPLTSA